MFLGLLPGVTPLYCPGGEPHGNVWPWCCGFVVFAEAQSQWPVARHLRARRRRLCHRQLPGGERQRDHPAPLRRFNKDTFERAFTCTPIQAPLFAQVPIVSLRGHGGHWQIPQGARPVVIQLCRRAHPHQQRMRKKAVVVHRVKLDAVTLFGDFNKAV